MRTSIRQRLTVIIPALACVACLGSAFAVQAKSDLPVRADSPVSAATGSTFSFASPATLALGTLGLVAMLRRPKVA